MKGRKTHTQMETVFAQPFLKNKPWVLTHHPGSVSFTQIVVAWRRQAKGLFDQVVISIVLLSLCKYWLRRGLLLVPEGVEYSHLHHNQIYGPTPNAPLIHNHILCIIIASDPIIHLIITIMHTPLVKHILLLHNRPAEIFQGKKSRSPRQNSGQKLSAHKFWVP